MRIKFVNAFNGNEEFGGKFFNQLAKLALTDIRVAQQEGGAKAIAKVLDNDNFKGKVVATSEYVEPTLNGLKEKVSYITFTMQVPHLKAKYSEDTGEFLEEVSVEETFTYYLEVRSNI